MGAAAHLELPASAAVAIKDAVMAMRTAGSGSPPPRGGDMLEGLAAALAGAGEVPALEAALSAVFPEGARLVRFDTLKPEVHRLAIESRDELRSVIAKRQKSLTAMRTEVVLRRCLPAVSLEKAGPALLGVAAERSSRRVWHVYQDLGRSSLDGELPDRARLAALTRLVARLHSRFVGHPLLALARLYGPEVGLAHFTANVGDALHGVRALRRRRASPEHRELLERLHRRLDLLQASTPMRAEVFREHAGPETLLHGDLWRPNTFASSDGEQAWLIDWDHASVGPAGYDVSTLLRRYPPEHRRLLLQLYADAVEGSGWRPPREAEANLLFETFELARYASHLCWPVLALLEGDADWAWEQCREVERWFEALEPMLPSREALAGAGS